MVFSSLSFIFVLLPLALIGYYLIPGRLALLKNIWLVFVSIAFYYIGCQYKVLWLLGIALLTYISAIIIELLNCNSRIQLVIFVFTIIAYAVFLCYWKYIYEVDKILPLLGVSFFVFQAMSYIIDVFRGERAERNPINIILYITFFPQLIAGPIVRYSDISEELYKRKFVLYDLTNGIKRFAVGVCKKVLLANTLGGLVNAVYEANALQGCSVAYIWLGIISYSLQIYYDFSGYSDMAIGLGQMFGFHYPENFNLPYSASSITDFWRRWHISLSSWFRDYVYIPLGGSRCSSKRNIINIGVVWLLTSLWHGFSWNYLLWGGSFFVLLIMEKYLIHPNQFQTIIYRIVYRVFALLIIAVLWVAFSTSSLEQFVGLMKTSVGITSSGLIGKDFLFNLKSYFVPLFAGVLLASPVFRKIEELAHRNKISSVLYDVTIWSVVVVLFVVSVSHILMNSYNPFLYFMF